MRVSSKVAAVTAAVVIAGTGTGAGVLMADARVSVTPSCAALVAAYATVARSSDAHWNVPAAETRAWARTLRSAGDVPLAELAARLPTGTTPAVFLTALRDSVTAARNGRGCTR